MTSITTKSAGLYSKVANAILAVPPYSLGFASDNTQSEYYLGEKKMTSEEIRTVSQITEQHGLYPENTRIRKLAGNDHNYAAMLESDAYCLPWP